MSATTTEVPPVESNEAAPGNDSEAASASEHSTSSVSVERLITNRPIKFPIFDVDGLLLLAEGSLITSKFKELLRVRNIKTVVMHDDDVDSVTLAEHTVADRSREAGFDSELTEKLDQIIESGNLFVANAGDALASQMQPVGCRAYDRDHRKRVVEIHRGASEALDGCMQEALRGKTVDGKELMETTGIYLSAMMADADCVLGVVMEVGNDAHLADHCLQMSMLGMAIGIEMGLDEENTRTLGLCGLLHDWGMVKVSKDIREAKHVLTDTEFVAIKRHPIYALEMLEKVSGVPSAVPLAAYQVHERPDGSGYPRGRKQHETHIFSRILGVADAYLALTSERPYRKALMPYAAMECLVTQASQQCYDPKIVKALLHIMSLFPIGSYVVLSDGSVARVLRRSGKDFGKPIVQVVTRQDGSKVSEDDESAIHNLAVSTSLAVIQALPTPGKTQIALSSDVVKFDREAM